MISAPQYTDTTIKALVAGYEDLEFHRFAGFTLVRTDEHDWVGHLRVNEATGPGGYLHGGLVYTFMDVISSFLVEARLGPRFYSKTLSTQQSMIRSPRMGTDVEFRAYIDRVADDLVFTRSETWALLQPEAKLVATGSATKRIQDRKQKPRPNDLDYEALARAASKTGKTSS
jgi:acyl-coenzyme A thioesterase PaaI-like protein